MAQFHEQYPHDPKIPRHAVRERAPLLQHIGEWWGEGSIWADPDSDFAQVDVHYIPASADRPHHTLVTAGMSDRPMVVPDGMDAYRHCELLLALPPDWPVDGRSMVHEKHFWPIRHLQKTARFAHLFGTWLWYGHTVGNTSELLPLCPEAPFVGFALSIPFLSTDGARKHRLRPDKEVHFFALIPLYEAELKFAWRHGASILLKRLYDAGVTELVQVGRPCVVSGKLPEPVPKPTPSAQTIAPPPTIAQRLQRWWTRRS